MSASRTVGMKGRESGMPGASYWESFFNPSCILERLGCVGPCGDVVEFGGNPLLPDSGVWRWLLGTAMRGDVPEVCFAVPGGCRWLPWWTLTNAKKSSDLPPGLAETLMLGGAGKPVAEVR